jgi:hypothetical protein
MADLHHIDFRFSGIDYEIWALARYNELLEGQLQFLDDQTRLRAKATLRSQGVLADDPEYQMEMNNVSTVTEEVLPRFFRGTVLISVGALLESGLKEIGDYIAEQCQSRLRFKDIKGDSPRDQWTKYFDGLLTYPLHFDEATWGSIQELQLVRNAFAHCNGRLDLLKTRVRTQIEALCEKDCGLQVHMQASLVSSRYTANALALVQSLLGQLIIRVRNDFPAGQPYGQPDAPVHALIFGGRQRGAPVTSNVRQHKRSHLCVSVP